MSDQTRSLENLAPQKLLEISIKKAMPHIFNRGLFYVAPSAPLRDVALFMIPLRELFASGIVVVSESKPIGRIGPKHVLQKFLELGYPKCLEIEARDIMVETGDQISESSPIRDVLKIFKATKFGFCPITNDGTLVATISTRDFLPIIAKMDIDMPVQNISSNLIFVSKGISIKSALGIMFEKNIRKMAIKDEKTIMIVDDRSLLNFLCYLEKDMPDVLSTSIDTLPKSHLADISLDTPLSKTATILMERNLPCSVQGNKIITPSDLVMKVLGPHLISTDINEASLRD